MKAQLLWGYNTQIFKENEIRREEKTGGFSALQIYFFHYEYKYGIGKTK